MVYRAFISCIVVLLCCVRICHADGKPNSNSRELIASLPYIPMLIENEHQGAYVQLVKAMDSIYPPQIKVGVYPFSRSIRNITTGNADFHLPMIRIYDVVPDHLPYRYISENTGQVQFVIYSNTAKPVTLETIKNQVEQDGFGLSIVTVLGLSHLFTFPIEEHSSLEGILRMVSAERIDAVIFAQEESDYLLRKLGYKNIHRAPYKEFDDTIIVSKNANGQRVDQILSSQIRTLKSKGEWQKLYRQVHEPYVDWQPYTPGDIDTKAQSGT